MDVKEYRKKTGVKSLKRDETWDDDCPYSDLTKFVNVIDHVFDSEFLEPMFGVVNTIKKDEFLESFKPGMFSKRVNLKWIFNLTKVRKLYHDRID